MKKILQIWENICSARLFQNKEARSWIGLTAFFAAVITCICLIVMPGIAKAVENGNANRARDVLRSMKTVLEQKLEEEKKENGNYWSEIISRNNSKKLILAICEQSDRLSHINKDDYYVKYSGGEIVFLSKRHKDVTGISVDYDTIGAAKEKQSKPEEEETVINEVEHIEVSALTRFEAGTILDIKNPLQTYFTDRDNLAELLEIEAQAQLIGGSLVEIPTEKLEIQGALDMTVPGEYSIYVTYNDDSTLWSASHTAELKIEVRQAKETSENLYVNAGEVGEFEVESFLWREYIEQTNHSENDNKEFTPCTIQYGGYYFYYPDGFTIVKERDNTNPLEYCLDKANYEKPAFYIVLNSENVFTDRELDENNTTSIETGDLCVDEDDIYVWQTGDSTHYTGWTKLYSNVIKYAQ